MQKELAIADKLRRTIADLRLEPGQTYRTTIGDIEVMIHRPAEPLVSPCIILSVKPGQPNPSGDNCHRRI
jgi:hypothetical protein